MGGSRAALNARQRRLVIGARCALVVALVTGGTGCGSRANESGDPQAATSQAATPQAATVVPTLPPPPPVAWGPCPAGGNAGEDFPASAQCGTLGVPVDYAKPDGAQAQLALIRFRATGAKIGSLVVNPGGPGASGVQYAAANEEYLTRPVLERFDRIGFDPRGVGASTPLIDCDSDADMDNDRAELGDVVVTAADAERENAEFRQFVQRCVDKTGMEFLANVGTANGAKDLDRLRAALSDEKLTYLGMSYGTFLGSIYAEAFPQNVRAMVLDGAVDPSADAFGDIIESSKGFQGMFDDYAADCAKQADCPLGTDPAKAVDAFHRLVDPLVTKPATTVDPRGLTYSDALASVFQTLYDDDSWPELTEGLQALAAGGDTDRLLALADLYYGRDENGRYTNANDALISVNCVDNTYPKDPAAWVQLDRKTREVGPFASYGSFTGNASLGTCAFWPVPPTTQPHRASAPGLPKVLVISTTGDPATPYQDGVDLAEQLGATLLTYEGAQHTASFYGFECVDDIVTNYLVDLTLPPGNARC